MNVNIVKSNKGQKKLNVNGFFYYCERKHKKGTFSWACAKRIPLHCKGRVTTVIENGIHKVVKEQCEKHTHPPVASDLEVCIANNNIKTLATISGNKPSQIIRNSVVQCPADVRVYLPTKEAQKMKIHRVRKDIITEPQNLALIDIPEELRQLEGELFVLCESEVDSEKLIIMGTKSSLQLLAESTCWIMDGTFEVVPSIMRQLFSIHGNIEGEIIPLIFCLMSQKTLKLYDQFFFELKKLFLKFEIEPNPQRIVCDFEKAIISSTKFFFPNTNVKGCLFHFGQILWRKIQKEGMKKLYGNSVSFSLEIRMIKSLAFVPEDEVNSYYLELKENFEHRESKKFGNWFEKNYLMTRNQSLYSPVFWTVNQNKPGTEYFPRTQNSVEAWHRRLKVVVGKRHAGLYKLIGDLSKEMIMSKMQVEKIKSGNHIRKKISIIQKSKKIEKIIKKRRMMGKLDFLKRIAISLSL